MSALSAWWWCLMCIFAFKQKKKNNKNKNVVLKRARMKDLHFRCYIILKSCYFIVNTHSYVKIYWFDCYDFITFPSCSFTPFVFLFFFYHSSCFPYEILLFFPLQHKIVLYDSDDASSVVRVRMLFERSKKNLF